MINKTYKVGGSPKAKKIPITEKKEMTVRMSTKSELEKMKLHHEKLPSESLVDKLVKIFKRLRRK